MTKHRWPGLEVHEVFAVVGVETLFSVAATMDSRLPGFQELDLWPRRTCQDMTGGGRLVFSFGTVDLAVSKERQGLIKHCHQHCYGELEDPSFCPDPQCRLTTLHPKWTTSRASWLLNVHLDPPMTFLLLLDQPTDLVFGFCPWWFLPPYYWRRHHSSGPLWPKKHSAIMMWPLPPLLSYSAQIQHSPLYGSQEESSSQITEAILSQQRPSLFHKCTVHFCSLFFRDT